MTMLEWARTPICWQEFLEYKIARDHLTKAEEKKLRSFVENQAYVPLCEAWERGEFPRRLPIRRQINKIGTSKKRIVYSFEGEEGIFLKFIAFRLFCYDGCFSKNCYAFRRSLGVKDAIRRLRLQKDLLEKYSLKIDVSDYFNSIPTEKLLLQLKEVCGEDAMLFSLFQKILGEKRVRDGERKDHILIEEHGAMAGIPIAPFFANIYLRDVDYYFEERKIMYFRYSDDILLFADSEGELELYKEMLYEKLAEKNLSVNPQKVSVSLPGQPFTFLGFAYKEGKIDLADITIAKMKGKIKRKADALRRWQRKKGLSPENAAAGLIHAMNIKFFGRQKEETLTTDLQSVIDENVNDFSDFTWSRWFFPNLTTVKGLKELDSYFQEYIRYTVTGRHYKGNYRITYNMMKEWGYRNLVHEYYKYMEVEKNGHGDIALDSESAF